MVYNIEMQMTDMEGVPKRTRYYQAVMDLGMIDKGESGKKPEDSFVHIMYPIKQTALTKFLDTTLSVSVRMYYNRILHGFSETVVRWIAQEKGVAAGNVLLLQQPLFGNLQQHFPAAFSGSAYLLNCLPSWSISKFSRRISSEIGTNSYPFSFKTVMTESRASAVYFAPLCIRMMEPSPRMALTSFGYLFIHPPVMRKVTHTLCLARISTMREVSSLPRTGWLPDGMRFWNCPFPHGCLRCGRSLISILE